MLIDGVLAACEIAGLHKAELANLRRGKGRGG